jgi:hypothetical protein
MRNTKRYAGEFDNVDVTGTSTLIKEYHWHDLPKLFPVNW